MKRKLCVASALLDSPDILLFDEPFSGLDYAGIREMRRVLLQNNREGVTQIVAAHDLECVADMATRFTLMVRGEIVVSGVADVVFDRLRDNGVRPPCSWMHMRELRPWDTV
jgi:biotin transport system ATP-binding protein